MLNGSLIVFGRLPGCVEVGVALKWGICYRMSDCVWLRLQERWPKWPENARMPCRRLIVFWLGARWVASRSGLRNSRCSLWPLDLAA